MDDFKFKLVKLIIGSTSDQKNQLMLTQRKVGEHVFLYFNIILNLYSFCDEMIHIEKFHAGPSGEDATFSEKVNILKPNALCAIVSNNG